MTPEEKNEQDGKKPSGCNRCATYGCGGCASVVLLFIALFAFVVCYHNVGENQDRAPWFNPKAGKNFSYDTTYFYQYVEFDISETDFLEWCKDETQWKLIEPRWKPFEIEDLHLFISIDMNVISNKRESPMPIPRYCSQKPGHKECDPWSEKCQHDPTGKTDNACFRLVDNGYYYEGRLGNGGGVYVLFDRENSRCYIYGNHH